MHYNLAGFLHLFRRQIDVDLNFAPGFLFRIRFLRCKTDHILSRDFVGERLKGIDDLSAIH